MPLTNAQRNDLHAALLSAFPRRQSLEMMLLLQVEKVLSALVAEGPMAEMVFALIRCAEAGGWTQQLIEGAIKDNPGNEKLQRLRFTVSDFPEPTFYAELQPNNLPPRRHFVGREQEIAALSRALHDERAANTPVSVTLYGMGGIGKTALALAYAYHALARYPGGVWWLSARGNAQTAMAKLLPDLSVVAPEQIRASLSRLDPRMSAKLRAQAVKLVLQNTREPSLLILDDVETEGWIRAVPSGEVRVLMTTRDRRLGPDIHLPLDPISLEHSLELAQWIAGTPRDASEARARRRALADLGGLPVAVEVAALAVKDATRTWIEFDRCLHTERPLSEYLGPEDYQRSVFASLDGSLDRCKSGTAAQRLLEGISWFSPDGVPTGWALAAAGIPERSTLAEEAFSTLNRLGLLRDGAAHEWISLHPLVHLRIRSRVSSEARRKTAARAAAAIAEWLRNAVDPRNMAEVDARKPHIDLALLACEELGDEETWLSLAQWLSRHLYHRGSFFEARNLLAEAQRKLQLRPSHAQNGLVDVLSTLGMVLNDLHRPEEALLVFEQARTVAEQLHGAEDRKHATVLANLGLTLRALERPREALPMLERAKGVLEGAGALASSRLAVVLACLGGVLGDLGRTEEARRHFEQSLVIRESNESGDDPKMAMILAGFAPVLRDLGEQERAREMAGEALARAASTYGLSSRRVHQLADKLGDLLPASSSRRPGTKPPRDLPSDPQPSRFLGRTDIVTVDFSPIVLRAECSPEPFKAQLAIIDGLRVGKKIVLGNTRVTIGRDSKATLALADDQVSLHHATISWSGWAYALTDLGSTKGTLLNGEAIVHQELRDGDRIRIGRTTFAFASGNLETGAPCLEVVSAGQPDGTPLPGSRITLETKTIVIGSSSKSNLQLPPVPGMSSLHARLSRRGRTYLIEDTGSRQGVWLNYSKVERALLRSGDRIALGMMTFRFFCDDGLRPLGPSAPICVLDATAFEQALVSASQSRAPEWPRALLVVELDLGSLREEPAAVALRQIEALLSARAPIQDGDGLARLSAARFALFLEATSFELARSVAESLRQVIAGWPFLGVEDPGCVTASFGVVAVEKAGGTSLREGLLAASDCLCIAQGNGGNRIEGRRLS